MTILASSNQPMSDTLFGLSAPAPHRSFKTIVEDVALMRKAMLIREWIASITTEIPRLNERPNPFYGCTLDGLALIQYYRGPAFIATPFGEWALTGGGIGNNTWFDIVNERLGLVEVMPELPSRNGVYGPAHAILRDLEGNDLQPCRWHLSSWGCVGLITERMFDTASYEEILTQAVKVKPLDPEDGDSRIIAERDTYPLQRHIWETQMKPALGFKEWNDKE